MQSPKYPSAAMAAGDAPASTHRLKLPARNRGPSRAGFHIEQKLTANHQPLITIHFFDSTTSTIGPPEFPGSLCLLYRSATYR